MLIFWFLMLIICVIWFIVSMSSLIKSFKKKPPTSYSNHSHSPAWNSEITYTIRMYEIPPNTPKLPDDFDEWEQEFETESD